MTVQKILSYRFGAEVTMRQLIALLLLGVLLLTGCDDQSATSTVEYRYKGLHRLLGASPATLPVVFHASPGSNVDAYVLQSLASQTESVGLTGIRFSDSAKRPIGDLTVEVAYQPDREQTGISLCQQKPVAGLEPSQKTAVLAIAICRDGRRLSSVRGGTGLPGDTDGNAVAMTTLIDGLTRALIGR